MPSPASIGPYRLLERVSVRPLTETWRAEQPQLARSVLVKTLKASVAPSSPFAEELDREAHVLSRVAHEGVVQLYEYVRTAEHVYLVIEDAGGHGLDAVLERAPALEPLSAVAITLELARALGNAHALGVVHRSLRPAAVALTAGGRVLVSDFSGAQQAHTPTLPEAFEVDAALAAPDYLAPEQILGEEVGAATDVFALGVILHEMVAGARPFRVPEGQKTSAREVALRIRNDPPPSLGQLADNVPRPWSAPCCAAWPSAARIASRTAARWRPRSRRCWASIGAAGAGARLARHRRRQARRGAARARHRRRAHAGARRRAARRLGRAATAAGGLRPHRRRRRRHRARAPRRGRAARGPGRRRGGRGRGARMAQGAGQAVGRGLRRR
ncbi:MAG: serine/threonine-protein kinase [Polyangiaceae bacterium]